MVKHRKDFTASEVLILLESIATGEVDPVVIDENTLFGFAYTDMFQLLMIASNQAEGSEAPVTICLGEALKAEKEFLDPLAKELKKNLH